MCVRHYVCACTLYYVHVYSKQMHNIICKEYIICSESICKWREGE